MSDATPEKSNSEIDELSKEVQEYEEYASVNCYSKLMKIWLVFLGSVALGALFGGLLFLIIAGFLPIPSPPIGIGEFRTAVSVFFGASVTVNGLVIGLVPVCSFFFLRELRYRERSSQRHAKDKSNETENERKMDLIKKRNSLRYMFHQNLRRGVLKYTQTYLIVSIFVQIFLVEYYLVLSFYSLIAYIMFDISAVTVIFSGIVPVIRIAFMQPGFRLVKVKVGEEERTLIAIDI